MVSCTNERTRTHRGSAGGVIPSVEPGLAAPYVNAGLSFSGSNALPQDFLETFSRFWKHQHSPDGRQLQLQFAAAWIAAPVCEALLRARLVTLESCDGYDQW